DDAGCGLKAARTEKQKAGGGRGAEERERDNERPTATRGSRERRKIQCIGGLIGLAHDHFLNRVKAIDAVRPATPVIVPRVSTHPGRRPTRITSPERSGSTSASGLSQFFAGIRSAPRRISTLCASPFDTMTQCSR